MSLEQSLAELVMRQVITKDVATGASSRPDQLEGLLERSGYVESHTPSLRVAGGQL